MPLISYAQNHEDVLLARLFPRDHKGFYIDVGANHPVKNNVTKMFYDAGWRGINIEPLTHLYNLLVEHRPGDINLHIGLSDQAASLTFFRVMDNSHSPMDELSHFDQETATHQRHLGHTVVEEKIPVTTLRDVCEKHVTRPIDILKIDVEGFERKVILGSDFKKFRPRVIVIEDGQWKETRARFDWQPLFEEAGFKLAAHDGVNCYFVDANDKEAIEKLQYPVNMTDQYIPFEYAHLMPPPDMPQIMEARDLMADLGPNGTRKIRSMARWVRGHPFVYGMVRRIMGIK